MKTFNRILCLIIITVIIGFTTPADATQRLKYTGIARSTGGAVLGSATVTIYLAGTTTAANVYEASTGGDSVTSVTSDSNGRWTFYADVADYAFTQEYKVIVTKDGYSTITLDNIFNLSLPTNAVGVLTNDGSGNYTWSVASFSESGDYSPTGTWDWSGATVSGLNATGLKLADDSTLTLPSAAVDGGWTTGLLGFGPDGVGLFVNIADLEATIPISGEITDEQVACWDSSDTPGTNKLKSCGAKTTDNSTATHLLCKNDSGEIVNCTLSGLAISGTTSPTITVTSAPAIPSGTNPTVDAAGEIAIDTDGANVTGDMTLRVYDGAETVAIGRKLHDIHVTVVKPQDLADAVRDAFLFWSNETGMTFTITSIKCWAGTDDTTLNVEETDADGQNNATVDAIECATNGTGGYTDAQTTITGATIEAGHLLWLDFDDTDDRSEEHTSELQSHHDL